MRRPVRVRVACLVALLLSTAATAQGQLISPGDLTQAHEALEGMRQCTQCHEAGVRGAQPALCLACHAPLQQRLTEQTGFHATLGDPECGACHKEHGGRGADIVRFDPTTFQHEQGAGFALAGAHEALDCTQCHNRRRVSDPATRRFKAQGRALDRTFLGLPTTCTSCHIEDNPHDRQFEGRECAQCHDEVGWEDATRYDHVDARFQLEGAHESVACTSCHGQRRTEEGEAFVVFRPLPFGTCLSCHEDEHAGQMGASCQQCHTQTRWSQIPRTRFESTFDHATTGFALEGAHPELACIACHNAEAAPPGISIEYAADTRMRSYPGPVVGAGCMSCHVDHHEGDISAIGSGADCTSCHTDEAWLPSNFDLFRHNSETAFELTGAHTAVPCASCHEVDAPFGVPPVDTGAGEWAFHIDATECVSCHLPDSPHGLQFVGRACESCHVGNDSFRIPEFDHDQTAFPLAGSHDGLQCTSCHTPQPAATGATPLVIYRPLEMTCMACHGEFL